MMDTAAARTKTEFVADAIEGARNFRFCGSSVDPDEQMAITFGSAIWSSMRARRHGTKFEQNSSP